MKKTAKKNVAAVELGRLGGLKGGNARAKKLSPRRRSQIARQAAQARWAKRDGFGSEADERDYLLRRTK